uniref:Uncharacterized protein n=1 Tax=Vitis vinifera TaxID=29760 RepID=F6HIQ8_VITVI
MYHIRVAARGFINSTSGFATVVGGTGLAVWNTPSYPSKAEQRAPYFSKSALKEFQVLRCFLKFLQISILSITGISNSSMDNVALGEKKLDDLCSNVPIGASPDFRPSV